jgi:hypothetical protein
MRIGGFGANGQQEPESKQAGSASNNNVYIPRNNPESWEGLTPVALFSSLSFSKF